MSRIERTVIKASAGTGKTFRLVKEYMDALGLGNAEQAMQEPCSPEEIVAVTFTRKAAAELHERVRKELHKAGKPELAEKAEGAFIGTVDSICLRLLQEYALEAGTPPALRELAEDDRKRLFDLALADVFENVQERGQGLPALYQSFGLDMTRANPEEGTKAEPVWQAVVRQLAESARVYGYGKKEMAEAAEASCREFMAFIWNRDYTPGLEEIKRRLHDVRLEQCRHDLYKASKTAQKFTYALEKLDETPLDSMRWKDWFSISKIALNAPKPLKKKGDPQIFRQDLLNILFDACRSREFREDAEKLIRESFSAAAIVVESFEKHKQDAGVIDFTDMERKAVSLLSETQVRESLRGRFRVLFVDEYQDTSPLQLRIFQLLGKILEEGEKPGRIIYVGDDKQSIYGFRGAVPELTRRGTPEVVDGREVWKPQTLPVCWRSLPAVTDFVNTFFSALDTAHSKAFLDKNDEGKLDVGHFLSDRADELRAENGQKALSSESRERQFALAKQVPSLQFWNLALNDKETWSDAKRAEAVAQLVAETLDSPPLVTEKDGQDIAKTRELRRGDIAVLCRTNSQCRAIAEALGRRGITARLKRGGLLEQDEVRLCLFSCRVAADPGDRFALAALHRLIAGGDWFSAACEENGLFHPSFDPLRVLHRDMVRLTPSEVLDRVLRDMDVFRKAVAWGSLQERTANIEILRDSVRNYEQTARAARQPITLQGWFDTLEKDAPERASVGENAVKVWTCHESKGLESPMVVLYGLAGKQYEASVWGLHRKCDLSGFSGKEDPLSLCSFVWLPDFLNKTFLPKEGSSSTAKTEAPDFFNLAHWAEKRAEASEAQSGEDLRLLYVAMTRPQSILAIVTESLKDKDDAEEHVQAPALCRFLDPVFRKDFDSLFEGEGEKEFLEQPCLVRCITPNEVKTAEKSSGEGSVRLFPEGEAAVPAPVSDGEKEASVSPRWQAFTGADIDSGGISSDVPRDQLGNMLHGWFAVWFGMSREQREAERTSGRMQARLERFCSLWNEAFTPPLWPEAADYLPAMSDALEKAVQDWFESREKKRSGDELVIRTEWTLEHRLEENANGASRLDSMRVDLMAEVRRADGTPAPCLIIDYKCGDYGRFGTDEKKLTEHLTESYGQRQSDYIRALHATGRECRCWLHLPLEGRMLEFTLNESEA